MDIKVQMLSFLVSFLFGGFYYLTSLFNKKIIDNKNIVFKFFISFVFVLNNVLIYLIILYKTSCGRYHIYFLFMIVIGFVSSDYLRKKYVKRKDKYWLYEIFDLSLI